MGGCQALRWRIPLQLHDAPGPILQDATVRRLYMMEIWQQFHPYFILLVFDKFCSYPQKIKKDKQQCFATFPSFPAKYVFYPGDFGGLWKAVGK